MFLLKRVALLLLIFGINILLLMDLINRGRNKDSNEFELLRQQNEDLKMNSEGLKNTIRKLQQQLTETQKFLKVPSLEYELTRRRIINDVTEMWMYTKNELEALKLIDDLNESKKRIGKMLKLEPEYKRAILNNLNYLSEMDGAAEWRANEAKSLSDLIQRRLHYLQNPKQCKTARKVTCNINIPCGFGCIMHHAVFCLIVAYGSNRTLIFKSMQWSYNAAGWESVFQPISETCTSTYGAPTVSWPGSNHALIIDLPLRISPIPDYAPLAIPRDLADRLMRVHGDPIVWWIGQFDKYLLRLQPNMMTKLDEMMGKLGFERPIVGIHVRRTDKIGTEASFHNLTEYMVHAEEYYDQLAMQQTVTERRIYLATDDPDLFREAEQSYPNFKFIGDHNIALSAGTETRYSDASLQGIILDVHLLSKTDHLICTFSSQICRLAYEMMQTLNPKAASNFRSLDDIYFYAGQSDHNHRVIYSHEPQGAEEIQLVPQDLIGIAGNHWNGFSKGVNRRTDQKGLYPSFKAINEIKVADFPTYPEVENNKN